MLLCRNNALKQKTAHSSMAYYVRTSVQRNSADGYVLTLNNVYPK
jgi:hypothetical protein